MGGSDKSNQKGRGIIQSKRLSYYNIFFQGKVSFMVTFKKKKKKVLIFTSLFPKVNM